MGMPLPDVDEESWFDHSRNELGRQIEERIQGFGLDRAIGDRIAQVQGLLGGQDQQVVSQAAAIPEPPPLPEPAPMPEPPLAQIETPAAPMPEPPVAEIETPAVRMPEAPVRRTAAPPAATATPPSPVAAAATAPDDWQAAVFGQALNAARRSGADLQSFADDFSGRLQSGVSDAQGAFGQALNAARRSGADVQAFADTFRPTEPPRPAPPAAATAPSVAGPAGANPSPDEVRSYIVQAAQQRGIDPNVALRVAQSEGGFEAARRGTFKTGSSWWPFQLHYGGKGYEHLGTTAGMGNSFTAETGYEPGDPNAWQAATDYALDRAKKSGWGAWYGAKAQGINGFAGIDRSAPDQPFLHRVGEQVQGAVRAVTGGGYAFPVEGYQGKVNLHWGEDEGGSDIFAPNGTPVVAMRGGKVTSAGTNAVGGNYVTIQGDDGNQYYYAHLDRAPAVRAGQTVGPGTYLGGVGDTGNAKGTGAHLHLGIGPQILSGTGPKGGVGGGFDAVGLLRQVLSGQPVESGMTMAAAEPPFDPLSGARDTVEAARQRIEQQLSDWEAESRATFERGRAFADEQLRSLGATNQPTPFDVADRGVLERGEQWRSATDEQLRNLRQGLDEQGLLATNQPTPFDVAEPGHTALEAFRNRILSAGAAVPTPTTGPSGEPVADIGGGLTSLMRELERQQRETSGAGQSLQERLLNPSTYIPGGAADLGGALSAYIRGTGTTADMPSVDVPLVGNVGAPELAGLLANLGIPSGAEARFGTGATRTFTAAERAARRAAAEPGLVDVVGRALPGALELASNLATLRLPAQAEVGFAAGLPTGGRATPTGPVYATAAEAAKAAEDAGLTGIRMERLPDGSFGWAPGVSDVKIAPASTIADDPLVRAAADDADKIIAERLAVKQGKLPTAATNAEVRQVLGVLSGVREQLTDRRARLKVLGEFVERKRGTPLSVAENAWLHSRVFEGKGDAALARLENFVGKEWEAIDPNDRVLFDAFLEQMDNPAKAAAVGRRAEREILERPLRRVPGTAAAEEAQKAADKADRNLARLQKQEAEGRAPGSAALRRAEQAVERQKTRLEELKVRTAGRQAGDIEAQLMREIARTPLRLSLRDAQLRLSAARRAYSSALEAESPTAIRSTERELDRAEWQWLQARDAAETAADVRAERLTDTAVSEIEDIAERGPRETPAMARAERDVAFAERDVARAQKKVADTGSAAAQKEADQAQTRLAKAQEKLAEATDEAQFERAERAAARGEQVRTERMFSGGARAQDLDAAEEAWRRRLGDERFETFMQAGRAAWAAVDDMRDRLVKTKVWSAEQGDFFKENFPRYIRSQILENMSEEAIDALPAGGRSFAVGDDGIKKLSEKGTEKARLSPQQSLVNMMFEVEDRTRRNEIMQILAGWSDEEFMAPFLRRLGPDEQVPRDFVAKSFMDGENGKQRLAVNKHLEKALDLNKPQIGLLGVIMRGLGLPLQLGATVARPAFIATNMWNDLMWSLYRFAAEAPDPENGIKAVGDLSKGYASMFGYDPDALRQRARLAGATVSGPRARSLNPEDIVRQLSGDHVWVRSLRNEGDITQLLKDRAGQAGDLAGLLWTRPLAKAGKPIEEAPRLGAFARALREGKSDIEAAQAYRTQTADFDAGGLLTKQLNNMIPFVNATTQASSEFVGLTGRRLPQSLGLQAAIVMGLVLNEIYNRSVAPEAYKDSSRYLRDHGIPIMSDKPPEGEGKWGMGYLPLRGGPGMLAPLVREAFSRHFGENPRTWQALAKEMIGSLTPIEPDVGGGLGSLLPPLGKTGFELMANYDFFRDQPIVPEGLQTLPTTRQYNERTSQTARALAQSPIPGLGGQSPMLIDYALKNISPGPAEAALGLGDFLIEQTGRALPERPEKGEPGARDIPIAGNILGRFLRTVGEEQRSGQYDRAEQIMNDSSENVIRNVENSPTFLKATPDRQQTLLRSLQRALEETAQDVVGLKPKARDLGLPPKYLGVKDPEKEMQIDDALSIYRAWEADPKNNPKPTKQEIKLALAFADRINPKYSAAAKRQEAETAAIRRQVGRTVSGR